MIPTGKLDETIRLLSESIAVCVLTGAGVSKESGVPTFRDALDGLWAKYDPQELATPEAFERNPGLVWDWYQYRRELCRNASPNAGHVALAELETRFRDFHLITQNVDDLHERAGSRNIIHLHGNIAQSRCFYNCQGMPTLIDSQYMLSKSDQSPPECPYCGRWIRPDVVWFGENLPQQALATAFRVSKKTDLMLVVGTSGIVTPAALLPDIARRHGAKIIEVNPANSAITPIADVKFDGTSAEVLPHLIEALNEI